jgi:hypothetical protein
MPTRTRFAAFAGQPPPPLPPEDALAFFAALAPSLSVAADPKAFAEAQQTAASELAEQTEAVLLERVLAALADPAVAAGGVEAVLDAAGVGAGKSAYAGTVFGEAAVGGYVGGLDAERRQPEVAAEFPAWRWHAHVRPTSRPHHAARDGRLYAAGVAFADVRGTDPGETINCQCAPSLVGKAELRRLRAEGGRVRRAAGG